MDDNNNNIIINNNSTITIKCSVRCDWYKCSNSYKTFHYQYKCKDTLPDLVLYCMRCISPMMIHVWHNFLEENESKKICNINQQGFCGTCSMPPTLSTAVHQHTNTTQLWHQNWEWPNISRPVLHPQSICGTS